MNTTQTQPARGVIKPTAIVGFGVAAVSIAFVSVVALGGFGGRGGNGGTVVLPPNASPSAPVGTPAPSQKPTDTPAPVPTTAPSPIPMPFHVELANASGADVSVDIVDNTEDVVGAVSGTPGEGMSVESYTVEVESVGATSVKLTWIDFGIDNALTLYVYRTDSGYRLVLIQPEPTGPADAMGYDRELILTFSNPVSTSEIEAFLQDGLDTPG